MINWKAYWTFDAGTSHDDSGNGYDGVDTGVVYGTPAKIAKAAQFGGFGGNKITVPALPSLNVWSVIGWFRATSIPVASYSLLVGDTATQKGVNVGSGSWLDFYDGAFHHNFGGGVLAAGTYYQFAVTNSGVGGNILCYVNGVLTDTLVGWGVALAFGRMGYNGTGVEYAGALDEIGITDQVLSGAEIAAIFNGGLGLPFRDPSFPGGPGPLARSRYARQLNALYPPGEAFDLEVGSGVSQVSDALAVELERIEARGVDLMNEADPRTASETLADWDRVLGLPDVEVPVIPADVPTHQKAITAKYIARGGQNYQFFADLVAACGYTLASIDVFGGNGIFRVGQRVKARVYGKAYAYAFRLNINAPAGAAVDHATLEAIIRRKTHSHVYAMINYL